MGGHVAPLDDGVSAPMHYVEMVMPDYYDRPDIYSHDRGRVDAECVRAIRAARGKPQSLVTIYRALPRGHTTINRGDWVTPSLTYARQHAMRSDNPAEDWPVISAQVPANTLWCEGYAAEWGYSGASISARTARLLTALADNDYSDSVMICLRPPEWVRKVFADMDECTEGAEDLHVTLHYLGSTEDAGGDRGKEGILRGLYDFAAHSGHVGLVGTPNGLGVFSNPESNVLITLWDIPGIAEFRTHLMDFVRAHGVEPRRDSHGFTPHMTLSYSEKAIRTLPDIPDQAEGTEWTFGSVWLVWGEEWIEVTLL